MVVPKCEMDYIFDLDDETLSSMIIFAKEVALKIRSSVECNRVAVMVLGLEVPHAHIHLVPINSEGDANFSKERVKLTPEEFQEIALTISSK